MCSCVILRCIWKANILKYYRHESQFFGMQQPSIQAICKGDLFPTVQQTSWVHNMTTGTSEHWWIYTIDGARKFSTKGIPEGFYAPSVII